jgi:hypothetical protein
MAVTRVVRRNIVHRVMPPVLLAGTHDVAHPVLTERRPAHVVGAGAGELAAAPAVMQAAAGCLAPEPCEGARHCDAGPTV